MTRRKSGETVEDFISRAIEAVSEFERRTVFVKVERIKRRKNRFRPTHNQARLLNWIHRQGGFVSYELCEGMNFMTLGLLKAKRLVVEAKQDGKEGIRIA